MQQSHNKYTVIFGENLKAYLLLTYPVNYIPPTSYTKTTQPTNTVLKCIKEKCDMFQDLIYS
jgi:hypothetical protein